MELDDLKKEWEAVTNLPAGQHVLTYKIIDQMTKSKYNLKINKIKYSEWAGGIVCLLGLSFIGFNFNNLNTIFLQVTGVVAMLLLTVLPLITYVSLYRFNLTNDVDKTYAEAVKQFAGEKIRFIKYQKLNAFLNYILLVAVIFLMPKLFFEKDISTVKHFWTLAFPLGYLFLLFFSKRIKRFYSKSLKQAEELLTGVEP